MMTGTIDHDEFGWPRWVWVGYSDTQLDAIRRAAPTGVSEVQFSEETSRFVATVVRAERVLACGDSVADVEQIVEEFDQDRKTIEKAMGVLSRRADWVQDPAPYNGAAVSALSALRHFLETLDAARSASAHVAECLSAESVSPPSNNYRPFQDRLLSATAAFWRALGGQVSFRKDYRAFFEAVVRPVVSTPSIRQRHVVGWSAGMFRTHVSKENSV
jgi:hypothetical protein